MCKAYARANPLSFPEVALEWRLMVLLELGVIDISYPTIVHTYYSLSAASARRGDHDEQEPEVISA
jgi:hypothetical protein